MLLLIFLVSFSLYHNYLLFIMSLLLLISLFFLLSSFDPLASLFGFFFLFLLSFSLFLWPFQPITFDSLVSLSLSNFFFMVASWWWVRSFIPSLSLSLWWLHGGGYCSELVLVWIDDRGFGFFVGVLEFYGFWFGCGFLIIILLATSASNMSTMHSVCHVCIFC